MKYKIHHTKNDRFEFYYRRVKRKLWIERYPDTILMDGGNKHFAFVAHREDGPAIIISGKYTYALNGNILSPDEYWNKQKTSRYANKIIAYILGAQ